MTEPIEIIVISLPRSTARREQAARQLDATGLPWSFLDAVDGAKQKFFPPEYDQRKQLRYFGYHLNPAQIGCFLSHRRAWEKCVQTGRLTLVFEDDFHLEPNFSAALALAVTKVAEFDLLKLQGINQNKFKILEDHGAQQLVRFYRDPLGATAYLMTPAAARVLLEKSRTFYAPIDEFMHYDWIHRRKILALLPYAVTTTGAPSITDSFGRNRASRREKWLVKIRRLPRSAAKKFYRLRMFPALYFTRTKKFPATAPVN